MKIEETEEYWVVAADKVWRPGETSAIYGYVDEDGKAWITGRPSRTRKYETDLDAQACLPALRELEAGKGLRWQVVRLRTRTGLAD